MRRARALATAVVLTVLGVVAAGLVAPAGARADAEGPVRILLMGDSVTQGAAGDYTWRYRLWSQLRAEGVDVDLVGPRDDLYDHVAKQHGSQDYVDPAFDRDHAARWGMTATFPDWSVASLVDQHDADVVVEMLGFTDLAYLDLTPAQVGEQLRTLVTDARGANPAVTVVLGEPSQQWYPGVTELDGVLAGLAADLDEPDARVVVATLPDDRDPATLTWDDSHPTAPGEVEIAAAVLDALASTGVGSPYPRPLPAVPLGPRTAPVLSGRALDRAAALRWTRAPGVDGVRVQLRDVTRGTAFRDLPTPVTGLSWTLSGLTDGHAYDVRLRPRRGRIEATDVWSNTVRVRPLPPRPGAVPGVRVLRPRADVVRLVGGWAPRARSYRLLSAPTARCGGPVPRLRTTALPRPDARVVTRAPRVWVRLVAVNEAGVGPGRTRCVAVP